MCGGRGYEIRFVLGTERCKGMARDNKAPYVFET